MRLIKLVPDNTNIGFVRVRRWAFGLTIALTLASLALFAARGLNMGVDFVGGLLMEVGFAQPVPLDDLRGIVRAENVGDVSLQQFGGPTKVALRLPLPPGDAAAVQKVVARVQGAIRARHPDASFRRVETVSGKVSDELIRTGVIAVALGMLGIALFTWLRFEWHFGVSTLVALVHDVIVTLGIFALAQWEFNLNVVAAILTIIGYSLNDKIVIDDRIRENLRKYRKMDMGALIRSLHQRNAAAHRQYLALAYPRLGRVPRLGRRGAARLHRRDADRYHRRHLFVRVRLVLAAHLARPDAACVRTDRQDRGAAGAAVSARS